MSSVFNSENILENKEILQNEPESVKFRRNSKTLVIFGTGVIPFGFWSIIKIAGYVIFGIPIIDPSEIEDVDEAGVIFLMVFVSVFVLADVFIRVIVGLCFNKEGRGKKVKGAYLVLAVWEILFGAFSLIVYVYQIMFDPDMSADSFFDSYITLFLELSSFLIMVEAFIAALNVRKYKSKKVKVQ